MKSHSLFLSFLGISLIGTGFLSASPSGLFSPELGSCAASIAANPTAGGYTLVCSGACVVGSNCTVQTGTSGSFGNYYYCPICTAPTPYSEHNCCHGVVQVEAPYQKYLMGVCYGGAGGTGCLLMSPCEWTGPNKTEAACTGGVPDPEE